MTRRRSDKRGRSKARKMAKPKKTVLKDSYFIEQPVYMLPSLAKLRKMGVKRRLTKKFKSFLRAKIACAREKSCIGVLEIKKNVGNEYYRLVTVSPPEEALQIRNMLADPSQRDVWSIDYPSDRVLKFHVLVNGATETFTTPDTSLDNCKNDCCHVLRKAKIWKVEREVKLNKLTTMKLELQEMGFGAQFQEGKWYMPHNGADYAQGGGRNIGNVPYTILVTKIDEPNKSGIHRACRHCHEKRPGWDTIRSEAFSNPTVAQINARIILNKPEWVEDEYLKSLIPTPYKHGDIEFREQHLGQECNNECWGKWDRGSRYAYFAMKSSTRLAYEQGILKSIDDKMVFENQPFTNTLTCCQQDFNTAFNNSKLNESNITLFMDCLEREHVKSLGDPNDPADSPTVRDDRNDDPYSDSSVPLGAGSISIVVGDVRETMTFKDSTSFEDVRKFVNKSGFDGIGFLGLISFLGIKNFTISKQSTELTNKQTLANAGVEPGDVLTVSVNNTLLYSGTGGIISSSFSCCCLCLILIVFLTMNRS